MCGRYTLLANGLTIKQRFHLPTILDTYEPSYNIAPGQKVFAIIHDGKRKRSGYLRWGLVPSWASDERIGYKMINARSETAHEKPSFRKLMAQKRCLIIADSFYEWVNSPDGKIATRIMREDKDLFAFAGLWDKWQQGHNRVFTCTLLTKASNEFMSDIHHRMPIILPKTNEDDWIKPTFNNAQEAKTFIDSLYNPNLRAYAVSNYVNKAKNNDAKCIEAI